jgi:cytochrome c peroxidase
VKAIASFERTIVSADSAFDRYLYKDDHSGMSPAAKRGVALFFSDRLKCNRDIERGRRPLRGRRPTPAAEER